jgi:hypothetical protein
MTREGEGPGITFIKSERQKQFMERQVARSKGDAAAPFTDKSQTSGRKENEPSIIQPQVCVC